ncbi:MAG: RHO alpha subunit C-terminal catalytic domain-containing protein, partial [Hyphomicrobiaceae bacterium]
ADWKNVWDNYLEDYHFPTGHPGLFGLMSPAFDREPDDETRTIRLSHALRNEAKGGWSSRAYHSLLPNQPHLPEKQQRRWSYFYMYPCVSFDVYPDLVDFFHIVPTGPGTCRLRVGVYGLPDADRNIRATRYLSGRINWQVHNEDTALIESVQGGLASSGYDMGLLGKKEVATRALQRWVQEDTRAD